MTKWLLPIVQTVVVVAILLSYYATSWFGEQFTLRAEPFDPWDPFYGEYVLLQYPDLNEAAEASNFPDGSTVYFSLEQQADGFATIGRIGTEDFIGALHGTVWDGRLTVENLEQFYVEQGQGLALEEAIDLQATIHVSPWGTFRAVDLSVREE
ncbi:GDYXXLXY domain-containing protein [Chryseomicrobium sp. FSL W7-1435]|uniref:GDYXXLXY domain-containing protein n=1 Tax=Chryseomicrobium sp. FSL W7-1435 TaxID=2921704 RepID=UPI00315A60B3